MVTANRHSTSSQDSLIYSYVNGFFSSIGISNPETNIAIVRPKNQFCVEGYSKPNNTIKIYLPEDAYNVCILNTCIHESTHLIQWFLMDHGLFYDAIRNIDNKTLNKMLKSSFSPRTSITKEGQTVFAEFLKQYGFNKDFVAVLDFDSRNYPDPDKDSKNIGPYFLSAAEISANEVAFAYVQKWTDEQLCGYNKHNNQPVYPDEVIDGLKNLSDLSDYKVREYSQAGKIPLKDFLKKQIHASGHFLTAPLRIKEGLRLNWAQAFDKAQKLCDKFNERDDYLKSVTPLSKHLELDRKQQVAERNQREYIRELGIPEIGVAPEDAFETTFSNDTFRSDIDSYNRNTRILGIDIPNHIIYYRGLEEDTESDNRNIFEESIEDLSEDEYNVSGKDPDFDNDER